MNWATAAECKRCQYLLQTEDMQDYSRPQYDPSLSLERQPLFSGVVKVLTVILALGTVALLFSRILHPFAIDTTKGIAAIFMLIGMAVGCVASIWTVVRIFEQSISWGLASLFIPFAGLFAIARFWEKTKRSFVGQLLCFGIVFAGYFMIDQV
jgi:hypothetical protein